MYHLSPTRVPSVRKQHCFISFAILFHIFPLVIYCLLHQWNHRVTGYEFCNRVEPKLEPKPITTSTREGPRFFPTLVGAHSHMEAYGWSWMNLLQRERYSFNNTSIHNGAVSIRDLLSYSYGRDIELTQYHNWFTHCERQWGGDRLMRVLFNFSAF